MPLKPRVAPAAFGALLACVLAGCADRPANAPVVEVPIAATSTSSPPAPASSAPIADAKIRGDRGDLAASLEVAIAMLEAQRYRDFLNEFVAPDDRARFEKEGGIDGLLPGFVEDKAQPLLRMLSRARSLTPAVDGDDATYDLPGKSMTWVKSGGRWYIRN